MTLKCKERQWWAADSHGLLVWKWGESCLSACSPVYTNIPLNPLLMCRNVKARYINSFCVCVAERIKFFMGFLLRDSAALPIIRTTMWQVMYGFINHIFFPWLVTSKVQIRPSGNPVCASHVLPLNSSGRAQLPIYFSLKKSTWGLFSNPNKEGSQKWQMSLLNLYSMEHF